jgi:hypothetical protein
MRTLRHFPVRFEGLPGRFREPARPVKNPLAEEHASSPLPPVSAEEPIQDWEHLWIDLGGEG